MTRRATGPRLLDSRKLRLFLDVVMPLSESPRVLLRLRCWRQRIRLLLPEHFFCGGYDPVRLEPELVLEFFKRSGRTKRLHADDATGIADLPLPSKSRGLFDGKARFYARQQNAVPVFLRLVLEDVPRWHGNHT